MSARTGAERERTPCVAPKGACSDGGKRGQDSRAPKRGWLTKDRRYPLPPTILYECQNKGLMKFAFRNCLILKDAISGGLGLTKRETASLKRKAGAKLPHFTRSNLQPQVYTELEKSQGLRKLDLRRNCHAPAWRLSWQSREWHGGFRRKTVLCHSDRAPGHFFRPCL